MARSGGYDIILMDARMPHMDGIETMRALREKGCKAKIIVLTADAMNGAEETYLQEGFDGYMAKPVSPEKLEDTLFCKGLPYNEDFFPVQ